jgi:hypothetical protein
MHYDAATGLRIISAKAVIDSFEEEERPLRNGLSKIKQ